LIYNEKFLELRRRIAKISENSSDYGNNDKYKNRIRGLDLKTNQKLNIISKNFNLLKDEFISIKSNYISPNNTSTNRSYIPKSFDYFYYKKEPEDNNKNNLKNYYKNINEDINRNIIDQQNNINLRFLE